MKCTPRYVRNGRGPDAPIAWHESQRGGCSVSPGRMRAVAKGERSVQGPHRGPCWPRCPTEPASPPFWVNSPLAHRPRLSPGPSSMVSSREKSENLPEKTCPVFFHGFSRIKKELVDRNQYVRAERQEVRGGVTQKTSHMGKKNCVSSLRQMKKEKSSCRTHVEKMSCRT